MGDTMTDEQLLEYRNTQLLGLREENRKLREDLREGLREEISLRDATNDGLITSADASKT
jgi:hypothetical protein